MGVYLSSDGGLNDNHKKHAAQLGLTDQQYVDKFKLKPKPANLKKQEKIIGIQKQRLEQSQKKYDRMASEGTKKKSFFKKSTK